MCRKQIKIGFIDWVDIIEAENTVHENFLQRFFRIKYSSFEKIISKGE
jgi:hypothetical protein